MINLVKMVMVKFIFCRVVEVVAAYRDERNKTWFVQFRYRDWQNNSRHTTKRGFKTKKEALNYEHEFKSRSANRVDVTISALIKNYLEDKKLHVKESSYISAEQAMINHVEPYLGKLKLHDLTPMILRKWQNEIIKLNLKPATTIKIHRHCSSLFNFAVKFYGLTQNPLRLIGSIGKKETSMNFWEFEEFNKFIKSVYNSKYRVIFSLLFFSGMRVGELLALNIGDLDFKNNKITINKNKMFPSGKITTTKTAYSNRTIEMPTLIMQTLKDYIKSFKVVPNPIFQITPSAILQAIIRYARRAGVKRIRIHDLRHSHASFLIHKGVPITAISKRLGHKSPKLTLEVYSHMYRESGEQIFNILQEAAIDTQVFVSKKS